METEKNGQQTEKNSDFQCIGGDEKGVWIAGSQAEDGSDGKHGFAVMGK